MKFVVFPISSDNEIQTTCHDANKALSPASTSFTLEADKLISKEHGC